MVPRLPHALLPPELLQSTSAAMHMTIPEQLDEPIEASQLALAFHHRILLHHQSVQTRGDQSPLFHPNQVTDLTLRIVNPTSDIFTVTAINCPNLRTLTVYDGVDFQPSHSLEVPCRFAPDWAAGLPGLCTIEKLTYTWTLDTPYDHAIEDPGRTRLTTRWDEDAERHAVSILVAASPSIQEIVFAVFRPFNANPNDSTSGRTARKAVWRRQSSAGWIAEVQDEIES